MTGKTPNHRKELASAIRRIAELYKAGGVAGTIGSVDVIRMLRSQGRFDDALELEHLLDVIKKRKAALASEDGDTGPGS
jgi:hypothetical protein